MQVFFKFKILIFSLFIFASCNSNQQQEVNTTSESKQAPIYFPVTDFLLGQLHQLDSMPVTPLKIIKDGQNKIDSVWLKREDIRQFAQPFLAPVIDSISVSSYFSVKSFLDQTINSITLTYDPKVKLPQNFHLRRWDVYIDPQSGTVKRIYIVKEFGNERVDSTLQLTWNVGSDCSIRTIEQLPENQSIIKEEKMIWNFD
jgi:hypothetical protein